MAKLLLTLAATIVVMSHVSCNIQRIGNDIKPSASGVDIAGATFLIKNIVLTDGVLFAYSAYFRSNQPITFQVWRPVTNDTQTDFRLVAQTRVTPSVEFQREDVYIESRLTEKCVQVRSGDRIGVYMESSPGAVAYVFDKVDPTALAYRKVNYTEPYTLGEEIVFDALTFPYDFSLSAHIYADVPSNSSDAETQTDLVECPKGVLIPAYDIVAMTTTTTPPPTGAPGAMGATGPRGAIGGTGATGPAGDTGSQGDAGSQGAVGATGQAGATGMTGERGMDGLVGNVGATGAVGAQGEKGEQGATGLMGPPGKIIFSRTNSTDGGIISGEVREMLADPMFSFGLLLWIAVLTVIVAILLIVVVILARRRGGKDEPKMATSPVYVASFDHIDLEKADLESVCGSTAKLADHNTLEAADDQDTSFYDTLRDESETVYTNDTLERQISTKKAAALQFQFEHGNNPESNYHSNLTVGQDKGLEDQTKVGNRASNLMY